MRQLTNIPTPKISSSHAWLMLAVLLLLSVCIRLPHLYTIPEADDEILQMIHAKTIASGEQLPLTGNDPYAGPVYFYFLAGLIKLGVTDAFVGRDIALVSGVLTVFFSCFWVWALLKNRPIAFITGLFVAVNPHLILLNSHLGGTTYLLPMWTTLFLWLLTVGVRGKRTRWLVGAGIAAGMGLQANPLAALLLLGGLLWLLASERLTLKSIGQAFIVGGAATAVYSPVIIFNIQSRLRSVSSAQERSYLWVDDPSLQTTWENMGRLLLQLLRQGTGVVSGPEQWHVLWGWALPLAVGVVIGGIVLHRYSAQVAWLLLPFLAILPIFTSHYGAIRPSRFTTMLIPGLLLCLAVAIYAAYGFVQRMNTTAAHVLVVLLVALGGIVPAVQLFRFYDETIAAQQEGAVLYEFCQEIGENVPTIVYVSSSAEMIQTVPGVPYAPQSCLVSANITYALLPPEQIVGRLRANRDGAIILLGSNDVATVNQAVPLRAWDAALNERGAAIGLQIMVPDMAQTLPPPTALVADSWQAPFSPVDATTVVADALQLVGYDCQVQGEQILIDIFWQVDQSLGDGMVMGFVHAVNGQTGELVAQNDHLAGGDRFPVQAWPLGGVVRDTFVLAAADVLDAETVILTGLYRWPELERLEVADSAENSLTIAQPFDVTQCQ